MRAKRRCYTDERTAMYVDRRDGGRMRVGYVIGFRNADWSHAPVERWIQQDWIEFRECKTLDLSEVRHAG